MTELVQRPLNAVMQVPDRTAKPIAPGTPISQIFDEQAGALLILGAPGTGKTTVLLELARDLLDRAEGDESQPIPVVFPLSSWAVRRQPLTDWLINELNQRSYVPKKQASQWVEAEQILPLLDGLDEVALKHREACVTAINDFRSQHGLLPIAVCSRIADYEALRTKLRLRTAIKLQPLTGKQVEDYLERIGEPLQGLRTAVIADESLWRMLDTPIMLWVATLAHQKVPLASVLGTVSKTGTKVDGSGMGAYRILSTLSDDIPVGVKRKVNATLVNAVVESIPAKGCKARSDRLKETHVPTAGSPWEPLIAHR